MGPIFSCLPLCEVVSWNYDPAGTVSKRDRCLPLCEVVSWNNNSSPITSNVNGLPLCEVVSWNIENCHYGEADGSLPLCEVVSWNAIKRLTSVWGSELNVFEGSMWYCRFNLIQWWESPDRRHSEPVVHIPEVWCRKELLYSYKFLSDSMKCPVFPVRFKHIFSCIFQMRDISQNL